MQGYAVGRVSQLLVGPQCQQRFGGALSSCAAQRRSRLTALPGETLDGGRQYHMLLVGLTHRASEAL